MRKLLTPFINFAINKAKRSRFVQNLFEAPFELQKFKKFGEFTDSFNNSFDLLEGLRNKIKPGWQNMFQTRSAIISPDYISKLKNDSGIVVNKIAPIVKTFGKEIKDSVILEFGCHSGASSYTLASLGAGYVTGTEFSGYKVQSVKSDGATDEKLIEANLALKEIRNRLSPHFENTNSVNFLDDDICNSKLDNNTFDIICSWEVLEHLHDTQKAFHTIARLLKPEGISIHEYNPFFCLNGGHSLCTLDFLWGHVRLNEKDFEKYVTAIRPHEKDMAMSFYKEGLNRMSIADLQQQLTNSGLELTAFLPYIKEQHVRMVDIDILNQSKKHYPNISFLDFVTPRIMIVLKKNG